MQKSQSDGGSSNGGIVTRSVAGLNNGIINDRRVTVPCTIKIDTFSQSTEKLQLKDGRGYYTLVKEDKQRYKIKDIKILRRRSRSVLVPWRKTYSRMNHRPHPNDRTGPYKRPLHSPPGEYSKQQRYSNDHNRHFSSPRGRGGGYGPRGSWNNGGYNNHRENRGGYQGSSPGNHYGNRSFSPQGHPRSKEWRSPERQNRDYRGNSYNNKSSYPRREPDAVERIPYKNGEAPRSKSLVSTYRNTEKSAIIRDDSGPNKLTEKKKEAPRTSENESCKVSSDSLVSGEPNKAESLSKSGTSLPVGKTSSDKETKRKEVLTKSEQIDASKGEKSETVEGDQTVAQSAEDSKLSSAVNKDGNAQATVGPQKTEVTASNHVQEESNEKRKKSDSAVEEVKQTVPVKVHSARKSAPTSALSRTQRKQMLNRQKLLKSQQTEEKDTTGSPKARMGSRPSDTDDKDSDRDIQMIDSDECSSDGPAKSKLVEDISSSSAQDPVASDTKGGPAMEETSKDTEKPTALEKKVEQPEANLPGSRTSSLSSNEKSSKTKLPGDEGSLFETAEEHNCPIPEKLASNTATKMSETSSIVKISSGKINEKGLQKIKDKLKKKLQEGKSSPSKGSLLHTQLSSSASTSSPSPEPQEFIKSKSEAGPENETSVSTPRKEVNTKATPVPEQDENSSVKIDIGSEISPSLATPNIVADLIAKDMLDSSDELDEAIDSSDSIENSVSITSEAKNTEQINAKEPTNTPASTAAELEVSVKSAAIESSSPPPKSPEEVLMEIEDEEPESIETSKHDDSVELISVEEKQPADEDLDDISVDLGPEEPDDLDTIDDDILLEDQPEVSNGDSAVSEISIARVESQATEVEGATSSCSSQAEKILAAPSGTAQSEAIADTPSIASQASVTKRRLSDDELEEEPVSKKSKAEEKSAAEANDEEVIDLESERSTALAPPPSENKPCGSGTENMIVFTQKEWKEFALSITDKYEKVVKMINQKTKEVIEKKEDLEERYNSLEQDYAVLQNKYDQLYSYAKKSVFVPKRTVEVQTDHGGKHNLSWLRRRSSKQTLAQKSAEQPAENAGASTSSETSSPATSDAASSSSSSSASTPSTSSAKGTNLDKKRQNFQAILNNVIKKGTSTSDLSAVPVSPSKPSPSPGTSVPSPSKPSSDATKSDASSSGPKSVESQESNAAITASGKTFTAASQGSHSLASQSPPSSTDTTKLSTNASSTAKQATSSPPPQPQPQSKNETQNTKTAIPDTGKSAPPVMVVLTNPARKSTEKQKSPPPESTTKSADSAKAGSSKSTGEPEVIDLTDDPDPPENSTAGGRNQKKVATSPSSKHSTLTTRSPHTLVPQVQASAVKMAPTRVTPNSPLNRVVSSVGSATQGHTAGTPGRDTSSGNRQSGMPARRSPSTSTSSLQVGNVSVPSVSSQAQGANVRNQVVGLQHGQVQRAPANQVSISQGNASQVFTVSQQRLATMPPQQIPQKLPPGYSVATVSGVQVMPNQQGPAKQATVRLSLQQQQQQQQQLISLGHLQQQRQGMHQLPGSAASAAALATRPPQASWMNQNLVSSASQVQMVQHMGQQQMTLTTQQLQMLNAAGGTVSSAPQAQTMTTSSLQARPQLAQQQQQQMAARPSREQQIQAQKRAQSAHAFNQAQANNLVLKQQQQQQQQQAAARQAAARIQSTQVGQQTVQQTQCKILNKEKREREILAQQHDKNARMFREQLSKLKGLKTKMKAIEPPPASLQEHQRKLRECWVQEKELTRKLQDEETLHRSCIQKLAEIEQQLGRLGTTQLLQQQMHQQQIQQQQQQIPQNRLQQQQLQRIPKPPARVSHPASLPDLFQLPEVKAIISKVQFTPTPLCPVLEIRHSPEGIVLSWKSDPKETSKVGIKQYYLYAYQESESSQPSTDLWKKIGEVDALPLPMACTLTHFKAGSMYHFAVAAVSVHGRPGKFSNTGSINLP